MEPVTDQQLHDAIHSHITAVGAFSGFFMALISALLPALVAFLQSQFLITPKAKP